MLLSLIQVLFTGLAYYLFNQEYFNLASLVLTGERPRRKITGTFFLINFSLFFTCSLLQLHLILNWVLFGFLLHLETYLYFRCSADTSAFFSFQGAFFGLFANILSRCVIALLLDKPLSAFDNNIMIDQNMKWIPIMAGFLSIALVFRLCSKPRHREKIQTILVHPRHLRFLLLLMAVMFAYLLLNLLLYSTEGDAVVLKLWGIASCCYVGTGYYLGVQYTLRLCLLTQYRGQNQQLRRTVESQQKEEQALSEMAYRDDLTGLYNRKQALELIVRHLEKGPPFCLCFLDLNGLKTVNDQFGHSAGDAYLLTVSKVLRRVCRRRDDLLFRYGGDEFIALFFETGSNEAQQRMELINRLLAADKNPEVPYPMSVSFGISTSGESSNFEELIQAADAMMYRQKRLHHHTRDNCDPAPER